jgi:DNA-directed RNA polymerase subunit L
MNVEILESQKTTLKLKFDEIDHGVLNTIKEQLWENKDVDMVGFNITHPIVGYPVLTLRTKKKAPKKVWNEAIDVLTKKFQALGKEFSKLK